MRRTDRLVTDPATIHSIITSCQCIRLGLVDNGMAYIVPVSFGLVAQDGQYTFYFHGAKAGRKFDLLQQQPIISFEMDTGYQVRAAEVACRYSAQYQSVMGIGRITILQEAAEQAEGLRILMEHQTGRPDWTFTDAMLQNVCIYKLTVTELSCKMHQ